MQFHVNFHYYMKILNVGGSITKHACWIPYYIPVYFGGEIFSQISRFSASLWKFRESVTIPHLYMCPHTWVICENISSRKEFWSIFTKIFHRQNKPVYYIYIIYSIILNWVLILTSEVHYSSKIKWLKLKWYIPSRLIATQHLEGNIICKRLWLVSLHYSKSLN